MENLYIVILAFISAVILGRIIIPNVLVISIRKRLFDVPDERKVHKRPVPRLGGVTFFPVILFSLCVFTALRLVLGIGPQEREAETLISEFLFLMGGLTLLYIIWAVSLFRMCWLFPYGSVCSMCPMNGRCTSVRCPVWAE